MCLLQLLAIAVVMQLLLDLILDILLFLLPQLVLADDDAIDVHDLAKLATDAYVVLQEVLATDVLIAAGGDQAVTVVVELLGKE